MKAIFHFESIGKKHLEEAYFFKFLVIQEFNIQGSKALQWCSFDELSLIIEYNCIDIVIWVENILSKGIITNTGFEYIIKYKEVLTMPTVEMFNSGNLEQDCNGYSKYFNEYQETKQRAIQTN